MRVELLSILTAPTPFTRRKPALSALLCAALLLLSGGNALAQGSVETDKAALEALYDATDGSNWTTSTNWKTEEPLSTWHGVTTDVDGHVTQLSLSNNQLTGTVPVELRHLSNLATLDVSGTDVRAPIHAAFQEWLETINFLGVISLQPPPFGPPWPEWEPANP